MLASSRISSVIGDKRNFGDVFLKWQKHLKSAQDLTELLINSIHLEHGTNKFYLVPFCDFDVLNDERIRLLAEWRQEYEFAFPSRFKVSLDGTKKWVKDQVLLNENRVLFWVAKSDLEYLGHLGVVFKSEDEVLEIDNVLRGKKGYEGLMTACLQTLERELEIEFSPEDIQLRVLESNSHAVNFYQNLGYVQVERTPLVKRATQDRIDLIEGMPADDHFVLMRKSLFDVRPGSQRILTAGPTISNRETLYTYRATKSGWNEENSSSIIKFENDFAQFVGSRFALVTSSCTGALHLSLLSLGIGPGDEVIVPDITWVATASAVMYVGAKPIFAEIRKDDWTIDARSIKKLITNKTKAIIPVHLYGYAAEMKEIQQIADENNLFVVEDAAPAIGTKIGEQKVGTFGDFGCYSFQGAKLLVTGEGGMLVTNDEALYRKARKIQDHGRKPGTFWIEELGHKYKMNNITAALGLAQLERASNQIYRKRRINEWYRKNLSDLNQISFQSESVDTKSICWMTSIVLEDTERISRDELIRKLASEGIDTRPVFPSISQYPIWGYSPPVQEIAQKVGENGINLPSGVLLTKSQVDRVSESVRRALA